MSKTAKPIVVIVLAIALAASAAVYLSRESGSNTTNPAALDSSPGGGRLRGVAEAPVTLTEFGDYQCPTCQTYHPIVSELLRRHPDKVKFEFRHYPLVQIHRFAMPASLAAEAAGEQGRYWEMHDLLFEKQEQWSRSANAETDFLAMANQLGLDADRFMQSLRSPELQQRVLEDVTLGRQVGVEGTPTFFINGQPIGLPGNVDALVQTVDDYLRSRSLQ